MALLIAITVVGVAAAIALAGYSIYVIASWPCVDATILRYRKSRGNEGVFYHPVYRFSALDGQSVVAISPWGSWRRPWQRGATVPVRYCPSNPRRTEIQCLANKWGPAATMAGLAAFAWLVRLFVA